MSIPSSSSMDLALLWTQGDWVTRTTALILLLMSVATWAVILIKAWDLWRHNRLASRTDQFWHSASLAEGLDQLGANSNPFRQLAQQGKEANKHHELSDNELHSSLSISDWIHMNLRSSLDGSQARLQSGLAILASIGSTAPFVGLFGTVWGIYHALMGISSSGSASIDKVAGPIGEALVMTAMGLAVAIPAVLGYNFLLRGNKRVGQRMHRFAHDLHAWLVTGSRVQTAPDSH